MPKRKEQEAGDEQLEQRSAEAKKPLNFSIESIMNQRSVEPPPSSPSSCSSPEGERERRSPPSRASTCLTSPLGSPAPLRYSQRSPSDSDAFGALGNGTGARLAGCAAGGAGANGQAPGSASSPRSSVSRGSSASSSLSMGRHGPSSGFCGAPSSLALHFGAGALAEPSVSGGADLWLSSGPPQSQSQSQSQPQSQPSARNASHQASTSSGVAGAPSCSAGLRQVECSLDNKDLWDKFNALNTEMIITKTGRRMFPVLKVQFHNLDPGARYAVSMDIVPVDNKRYRYVYHKSSWQQAGKADPSAEPRLYPHPDSPFSGDLLARQVISFEKVKLTNNEMDKSGHIILNSMHKYQPRVHLIELRSTPAPQRRDAQTGAPHPKQPPPQLDIEGYRTFVFPETVFTAVTAYQNQLITKLKIDKNPFAKGFRDSSRISDLDRADPMYDYMSSLGPGAVAAAAAAAAAAAGSGQFRAFPNLGGSASASPACSNMQPFGAVQPPGGSAGASGQPACSSAQSTATFEAAIAAAAAAAAAAQHSQQHLSQQQHQHHHHQHQQQQPPSQAQQQNQSHPQQSAQPQPSPMDAASTYQLLAAANAAGNPWYAMAAAASQGLFGPGGAPSMAPGPGQMPPRSSSAAAAAAAAASTQQHQQLQATQMWLAAFSACLNGGQSGTSVAPPSLGGPLLPPSSGPGTNQRSASPPYREQAERAL